MGKAHKLQLSINSSTSNPIIVLCNIIWCFTISLVCPDDAHINWRSSFAFGLVKGSLCGISGFLVVTPGTKEMASLERWLWKLSRERWLWKQTRTESFSRFQPLYTLNTFSTSDAFQNIYVFTGNDMRAAGRYHFTRGSQYWLLGVHLAWLAQSEKGPAGDAAYCSVYIKVSTNTFIGGKGANGWSLIKYESNVNEKRVNLRQT